MGAFFREEGLQKKLLALPFICVYKKGLFLNTNDFVLSRVNKTQRSEMKPFMPNFLPLEGINWEGHAQLVGQANRAIARYDGLLQGIPDPVIMLSPLTSQEAVLSSKIEGIRATLGDLLKHDAGDSPKEPSQRQDIVEIENYRLALWYAKNALLQRPFSLSLLKELHQRLLSSVRGKDKNPGKFRTSQNWIGTPGTPIEEAFFVPPAPYVLADLLNNFIEYYRSDRPDPLVQLAILHAQFEIIHPFDDGNGRLGRMIIPLFLFEKKILSEPMFYLSGYLEQNREIYVHRLRKLGTSPDNWNEWIQFFMQAIVDQAEKNVATIKAIKTLYDDLKREVLDLTHSQYAVPILDYMFSRPVFKPADLAKKDTMPTRASLSALFNKFKEAGIVTVYTVGAGSKSEVLVFPKLFNICEGRKVFEDPRD